MLTGPTLNSGSIGTTSGVTDSGARLGLARTVGDFDADGTGVVFAVGTGSGDTRNARRTGKSTRYGTLTTTGTPACWDAASGHFHHDGYADVAPVRPPLAGRLRRP
ncbi:hypothetical protein ABZ835_43330 [Streptomyces sp. NPDC047461]|uniref:hypothetical protein n=1 Tax=Streptomyces sp. NPDC047461 TaxID=3155619 RepID=UPI0033FB67DB